METISFMEVISYVPGVTWCLHNIQECFLAEGLWICNNTVNFEFANSLRLPAL